MRYHNHAPGSEAVFLKNVCTDIRAVPTNSIRQTNLVEVTHIAAGMIIDRQSRDRVAADVRSWMHQQISNAELLNALDQVVSDDPTIEEVRFDVQLYCPDDSTEQAVLYKHSWNHLQRLLLVLASDHHIDRDLKLKQHVPTLISSGCLLASLVASCMVFGISWQLLALWLITGTAGMMLLFLRIRAKSEPEGNCQPFASDKEMLELTRQVPEFQMVPPPPGIGEFKPPSILSLRLGVASSLLIILAPLTLLVLMAPIFCHSIDSRVTPSLS